MGKGLKLLRGEDRTLPVRIRWVVRTDTPEAVAVDGDFIYVAGSEFIALRLSDGSVAWRWEEDYAFEASGDVQIGPDGADALRVFAPSEYDLRVDRQTGSLISIARSVGMLAPAGFSPFPAPPPTRFRIETGLKETIAYWPDGRVAWRLVVKHPFVDEQLPIDADGSIVYVTSGQHVVVLDPVEPRIALADFRERPTG